MTKYIMSDNYEILENDFQEVVEYLSTEKFGKDNGGKDYLMGFNSPLLTVPTLSLYDDAFLLEKFPNGLVTENFILVPAEQFKQVKENSTTYYINAGSKIAKLKTANFSAFFNQYMNAFVEVNLNIELTQEEKEILSKNLSQHGRQICDNNIVPNPEKLTNRDLLKVMEGKDYSFEKLLKIAPDLNQDVKEILKKNENYLENISSIKNKIQEVKLSEVNENISVEEFKKIVEKSQQSLVSPVVPLKIVNKKIDQLLTETNGNIEDFVKDCQTKIFPFMVQLDILPFKNSMEHIFKEVFKSEIGDYSGIKTIFAKKLADTQINNIQRDYLIGIITGYDALSTMQLTSNHPQKQSRYNIK